MKILKIMNAVLAGAMVFLAVNSIVPVAAEGNGREALRPTGVVSKLPTVAVTTWEELKSGIESAAEDTEVTISGTITRNYNDETITLPAGIAITINGSNDAKLYYDNTTIVKDGFVVPDTSSLKLTGSLIVEVKNYMSSVGNSIGI